MKRLMLRGMEFSLLKKNRALAITNLVGAMFVDITIIVILSISLSNFTFVFISLTRKKKFTSEAPLMENHCFRCVIHRIRDCKKLEVQVKYVLVYYIT